jgi:hypothetical protein
MERRHANRVLIIGARGVLGMLTARAFGAAGWEVRRGVRRAAPGEVEIDLDRADSVLGAVREHELVVNTVPHRELLAERAVLERGGALINISALPAAAGRALRAVAAGARGVVLMNAGLAPGVTTIVAADLLRLHPDAEELEIAFTLSSTTPRGPASADFAHRGLAALARHRTVVVPLPDPFGQRRCLGFGEQDAAWLGGVAEGRIVRGYLCVSEPAVHERLLALNRAGGMTGVPRDLLDPRTPAADAAPSDEPVAHWIAAVRSGRRLGARTVQCRGDYLHAARSAVVFANLLRTRERAGGCFDPDEICTLDEVKAQLREVGITIVAHSASPQWSSKCSRDWP